MAFTDVPDDLPSRPLTDARLVADVLDLVVPDEDRRRGAVALLLCDDDDRLVAPVLVGDLPDVPTDDDRDQVLGAVLAGLDGRGAVHVAVARKDGLSLRPGDHAWARAAVRACAEGTRLLGVHVVTVAGSRDVPSRALA